MRSSGSTAPVDSGYSAGSAAAWRSSAALIRILFIALSVLSAAFPGLLVYLALWLLIPEQPRDGAPVESRSALLIVLVVVVVGLIIMAVIAALGAFLFLVPVSVETTVTTEWGLNSLVT